METIGELAHRTHTSARMLRHWEAEGLLEPTAVDPWTRSRLYAPAQSGRVRAIFALRELLSQREAELAAGIARDTAALARVRERLRPIDEDEGSIASSLELTALPALRLRGLREIVGDETEIPDAVHRLLSRLAHQAGDHDLVLGFDGTSDPEIVTMVAGVDRVGGESAAGTLTLPGAVRAAIARWDSPPARTDDAWTILDTALAERGLRAAGPHRQVLHAHGGVTLATPVLAA